MVKHVPALAEFDSGNGICRYLENNLCSIYERRPDICNIAKMYDKHFRQVISEDEFIRRNMEVCLNLAGYDKAINNLQTQE
jgi:Fe-S-cluster containining protein